jgi:hypothetical protein
MTDPKDRPAVETQLPISDVAGGGGREIPAHAELPHGTIHHLFVSHGTGLGSVPGNLNAPVGVVGTTAGRESRGN